MIGILTLGAIALGLAAAKRKQNGIGRVKRRIYCELSAAQKRGIDFEAPYGGDEKVLLELANRYGYKGSKRSTKPLEEQYFNSLQRAYKAISGIGVGSTSLPRHKYEVTNGYGDVVLAYYDFGTDEDRWNAARDFWRTAGEFDGYNRTVQYIAEGGKFLWSGGKGGVKKGIKEECFASRFDASGERKKRLSYLSKDGLSPKAFAHRIWESGYEMEINRSPDDMEILDGVIQAILDIENAGQARKMIMDFYLEAHLDPETPAYDMEEEDGHFFRPWISGIGGI